MPMNLIEQQQALRDLPDPALQQALNGGVAPPYLVLAEINRRKDARERYAAAAQKFNAKQSTVMDDTLQGLAAATSAAANPMPMAPAPDMGGIAAALPPDAGMAPDMGGGLDAAVPGYASGGIIQSFVGGGTPLSMMTGTTLLPGGTTAAATAAPTTSALTNFAFKYPTFSDPYAKLREMYASQLKLLPEQQDRARAMALIAAGTGMMQGGQNTLANIGAAFGPAMQGYQDQINTLSQQERDLLGDQARLDVDMANATEAQKERFRDSPEGRAQLADALGLQKGTDEYERYVALNQMPTPKPAKLDVVDGYDALHNLTKARYDARDGLYYDEYGSVMKGFRELTPDEKIKLGNEAKDSFTSKDVKVAALNTAAANNATQRTLDKIEEAKQLLNSSNVTGWAAFMDAFPGKQRDFRTIIDSLGAEQIFQQIQVMKEQAAQTGARGTGLGATSDVEIKALRDTIASLDRLQGKDSLLMALDKIREHTQNLIAERDQGFRVLYGAQAMELAKDDAEFMDLLKGGNLLPGVSLGTEASGPTTTLPDPLGRNKPSPVPAMTPATGTGTIDPNNPNDPRNFLPGFN